RAKSVVPEIELEHVPAGRKLRAFPAHPLEVDEIPEEHRLALEDVEAVAAKAPTLRDQHALGANLRNLDLDPEVVGRIEQARRIAVRGPGRRLRRGEHGAAGAQAGPGRDDARDDRRVER